MTFWQKRKIKFCIIFGWLLFPLVHRQASLLLTHIAPTIKDKIFKKHSFSVKYSAYFLNTFWEKQNLRKNKLFYRKLVLFHLILSCNSRFIPKNDCFLEKLYRK